MDERVKSGLGDQDYELGNDAKKPILSCIKNQL